MTHTRTRKEGIDTHLDHCPCSTPAMLSAFVSPCHPSCGTVKALVPQPLWGWFISGHGEIVYKGLVSQASERPLCVPPKPAHLLPLHPTPISFPSLFSLTKWSTLLRVALGELLFGPVCDFPMSRGLLSHSGFCLTVPPRHTFPGLLT